MSNFYQLSFFDINKKFRKFLTENSSNFIELLKNYIPFSKLIPSEFKNTYNNPNGRNRKYSIESIY